MYDASKRHGQLLGQYQMAEVKPEALARAQVIINKINHAPWLLEFQMASDTVGTGIPPWFIGALLYRESDMDLRTYLGNGERIIGTDRKTTLVPKLRGPFATFHDGAVDALNLSFKGMTNWQDTGNFLVRAELWNGLGYARMGVVNPYLFSGTSIYDSGKYDRDGHYNPALADPQLGIACIMKALQVA